MKFFIFLLLGAFITLDANAASSPAFEKIFRDWTEAFNHKKLNKTCALFSEKVTANYQGTAPKNYVSICDGFKKIFQEKDSSYQYHFKLRKTYRENNLAAVRITWYLDIYKNGKILSQSQDEGIDIFERNNNGEWKIINYIGYPVK